MGRSDSYPADAQLGYLFKDSEHQPPAWLRELLQGSARFQGFVVLNRDKIRKKIRGSKYREDVNDVLAELRVAYLLLLDERIEIDYEKYGSKGRAPDLTATFMKSVQLNIEVAHIRRAEVDARFQRWYRDLRSRVGVWMATVDWDIWLEEPETSLELIEKLEQSVEPIAQFVKRTIQEKVGRIAYANTAIPCPVEGFENVLTLELSRDPFELGQGKDRYVHSSSVAYTQKENRKFGDIVVAKVGQLRSGMINVIFIISDSDTHEAKDFDMGTESLFRALSQSDDTIREKILREFTNIEDFDVQSAKLSGIVFRSRWDEHRGPNVLWCNPSADNPIPEVLSCCLRSVDHPLA